MNEIAVRAPGRVTLIGDHTDYTGGWCFPMAIDRTVRLRGRRVGDRVELTTADHPAASMPLGIAAADVRALEPEWARYVGGVVAEINPTVGLVGDVTSNLPAGAGLSSSAALELVVALALGADTADPVALARLCRAAEHSARGVPTGLLDQLACIGGVAGHGLLLDCSALTIEPVPLPPPSEVEWVVISSGRRDLAASQYSTRVAETAAIEQQIGPLRDARLDDLAALADPLRRRARHVVTENRRVGEFAAAVRGGDIVTAAALMNESHASLRDDYESSAPIVDELVGDVRRRGGVLGARITGGGWGGCIIVAARPGALDVAEFPAAWSVRPSPGVSIEGV